MISTLIMPCVYAFFSCFFFTFIYSMKDIRVILAASLGGALGWMGYLLVAPITGVVGQNLVAAVIVALFSEIASRVLKTPSTLFLIVGILPMVPGGGIYYTMEYCIQGNNEMFISKGLETFAVAGAIAIGVSLGSAIFRFYTYNKNLRDKKRLNKVMNYDRDDN